MTAWRVLYVDNSGQGRYDDVEAETANEAVWQAAQDAYDQTAGRSTFTDVEQLDQ